MKLRLSFPLIGLLLAMVSCEEKKGTPTWKTTAELLEERRAARQADPISSDEETATRVLLEDFKAHASPDQKKLMEDYSHKISLKSSELRTARAELSLRKSHREMIASGGTPRPRLMPPVHENLTEEELQSLIDRLDADYQQLLKLSHDELKASP